MKRPQLLTAELKMKSFLRNKMINTVDNSLKTSLTLDFITLQEEYAEAVPVVGDLVPVKDDIIDVLTLLGLWKYKLNEILTIRFMSKMRRLVIIKAG